MNQNRADVLNAGINKNKLSNSAADHYYQISGKHDWTDDEMQSMYYFYPLPFFFSFFSLSCTSAQDNGIL